MKEQLYRLARHIAAAKGGLPAEWQDWAEEIESDLRRLSSQSAPVVADLSALDNLAGEFLNVAINCNGKVKLAYTQCAHRLAETVRDCRAAMPQQAQQPATDNTAQQFEALATSKPQREAYEIIKFGTFKATEIFTDDKREFRFSEFELNCNEQIASIRNVSVKKTLQAVINALQEYCDSIDDEKFTTVLNSNLREANNDTENLG